MKKLIFALCLFCSTAAMAQIEVGLKGGAMLTNTEVVNTDTLPGTDPRLSFLLGGYMNIPLSSRFSMQPELLYANKGGKNLYRHYINLPLMLQYKVTDRFKVEAGPEIGYLLGTSSRFVFGSSIRSYETINEFDLGINIGANYTLTDRLNIGLRYNYGIYDTYEPPQRFSFGSNISELPDYNVQNRSLQLSVGWKLGR